MRRRIAVRNTRPKRHRSEPLHSAFVSQNLRNYVTAIYGLDHVLRLVPDSRWDAPSPCEGWTVRDAAGHAMGVISNVRARITGEEPIDVFRDDPSAIAGDDPYATWYRIRGEVLEALDRPGSLQIEVAHTLGVMPIDTFITHMCADATIHTWDIARGAGVDERLDRDLVAFVDGVIRGRDDAMNRAPKRFAAQVQLSGASAEDAQARMLAFAGRTV